MMMLYAHPSNLVNVYCLLLQQILNSFVLILLNGSHQRGQAALSWAIVDICTAY